MGSDQGWNILLMVGYGKAGRAQRWRAQPTTHSSAVAGPFRRPEIALIREVVATCGGLSRKELANTISE